MANGRSPSEQRDWRHPGLDDLVERLRAAAIAVGPSEILDAARLLRHLAERARPPSERAALRGRLRPVFCKSSEDQKRFDRIFDAWAGQPPQRLEDRGQAGAAAPGEGKTAAPGATTVQPERRLWPWLSLAVAALLLAGLAWWIQTRTVSAPEPAPTAVAEAPAAARPTASDGQPRPRTDKLAQPRHAGYFPALRQTETLRPAWAWGLLLAPLLGLLLLPVVLPQRGVSRGKGGRMRLEGWPRDTTSRLVVARLAPTVVGRLDRHLRGPASELARSARRPRVDLPRTVRATLRRLGVPTLRYLHARLRPSYLMLVDARREDDLAVLWAERLRHEGIELRLLRLERDDEGQPMAWRGVGEESARRLSLDALPHPAYGQRLAFVGDGTGLLDEHGGWADWARRARFRRWPERALFTPREPRHWGPREELLGEGESQSDNGFLVLPQDDNALAAWAGLLVTGELPPITLSEPQRYPALLDAEPERFLDEAAPDPDTLLQLVGQLKAYLGENGYYWLSTCAVPPLIDHRLTLLLGREFLERSGAREHRLPYHVARNYRLLTRLPWLRQGHMPDWLRLALLASLPERVQDEVRRAVEGLLAPQRLSPRGDLPLAFEPPPRGRSRRRQRPGKGERDALYLGFMDGLSAQQLSLRMPGAWRDWAGALVSHGGRWCRLRAWLAAALARLWYRHGLAHQGAARARLLAAGGLFVLSAAILFAAFRFPPGQWAPLPRAALFEERVRSLGYQHAGGVNSVALSADGGRAVSASDDGTARLWDPATGQPLGAPLHHENAVAHASFSPDGGRVLTASLDGTARLWAAASGQPLGAPLRHLGGVRQAAFSADGRRLVTASEDGMARLWDSASGRLVGLPFRHGDWVYHAAFSPDGTKVLTASADKTARLWDVASGRLVGAPLRHEGRVYHAVFSLVGGRMATASEDKTARLWDAASSRPLAAPLRHAGRVLHAGFSPDGKLLATACGDGTARLWDAASGQPLGAALKHQGPVTQVHFSPDGKLLATASEDGTARLWDVASGEPVGPPLRHAGRVWQASFGPDGGRIVSASADGAARVWTAAAPLPSRPPLRHEAQVIQAEFSPDGERLVTASSDGTARLWNARDDRPLGAPMRHGGPLRHAAFSPEGGRVVTASMDGTARLWDTAGGQALGAALRHDREVNHAAFSPDGARVITASADGTARLWDGFDGRPAGVTLRHGGDVLYAAYSPDGRRLVTAGNDGRARLWDAASGQALGAALRHDQAVNHAAFSRDGQRLVTASSDGSARMWDAATGQARGAAMRHAGPVVHAAFSPDGTRVVTASVDGAARVWDAGGGQPVTAPLRHGGPVAHAAFSPDGKRVASAGRDGTVRVWDAASGAPLTVPMRHGQGVWRAEFSPDGARIVAAVGGRLEFLGLAPPAAPPAAAAAASRPPAAAKTPTPAADTSAQAKAKLAPPSQTTPRRLPAVKAREGIPTSPPDKKAEPVRAPEPGRVPAADTPVERQPAPPLEQRQAPAEQAPPPEPPQGLKASRLHELFIASAHAVDPPATLAPAKVAPDPANAEQPVAQPPLAVNPTEADRSAGHAQIWPAPPLPTPAPDTARGMDAARLGLDRAYRDSSLLLTSAAVLLALGLGGLARRRLLRAMARAAAGSAKGRP